VTIAVSYAVSTWARLGHGPMDAFDGAGLAAFEDRGDGGRVASLHVLRDVGLAFSCAYCRVRLRIAVWQLGLFPCEAVLLGSPAVEILLEFLEALARFLGGRLQFLELPVGVLMLDLILFRDSSS